MGAAVPVVTGEASSSSNNGDGLVGLIKKWRTDAAIPAGDRFVCFVDYIRGILLCDTDTGVMDMESDCPLITLTYVPLPVPDPGLYSHDERPYMQWKQNLSATATTGPSAVRFVSIESRCCCSKRCR